MSDRLLKESDVMRIAFQLPYVVNSAFFDAVKALPSADRPQGYWTNRHKWDNGFVERECSLCGAMKPILMHTAKINYCPNCGARMKGADDE